VAEKAQKKDIGRRYVGTRETVGFVLFDAAANVKINSDDTDFIDRVFPIDRGIRAFLRPFMVVWDAINDLFVAALVDKSRTRFGKFRPYLVLYPAYGLPVIAMFFALPFFFWQTPNDFMPKIAVWLLMKLLADLTETFHGIARTGMIANLTPNPQERILLITKAAFFSMFGEDGPKQVFAILRDIISNNKVNSPLEINENLRKLFLVFGVGTVLIVGGFYLYFALVSRERVFGAESHREKPPSIRESLAAVRNNRPLLILMLVDILDGFTIKGQMSIYEKSVQNFANFGTISGLPGSIPSYVSYAYVPKLRERFSSKALWITQSTINAPLYTLVFLFGMLKVRNPKKRAEGKIRMFQDRWPMIGAFGVQNTIDMFTYGIGKVIPEEIRNECIDYGEWKNGIRSEGMTGALRGMPKKFTDMIGNTITDVVLDRIGFKQGTEYTRQPYKVALGIFALATVIPALMKLVVLVPKLLFNISQKDREVMYAELAERRALAAATAEKK